jgi:hypothetical protein
METSAEINELAAALSKAQAVMTGAKKDADNPFFKSKYADLESVWGACREPLAKNGLAVIQTTSADDVGVYVTTLLAHSSGQWVRDSLRLSPKDAGPQALGSCLSYGRRYALAAMVGVYQTDDDAEAGQGRSQAADRSRMTKSINEYSRRINEALTNDMESAAVDICREAKEVGEDFMADIWHTLSTPVKHRLRDLQRQPVR